ncbi:SdpI family protein [Bacillus sp. KH172YL63]|uniref:SdpI family protein n=1 Tax=Bacillus sp. KH172YL63 TaxID=2709784 RepID=UPI0013E4FC5B|nr:SdpI family protein [Bacillus sp. KH172YL63]BCB03940.1 hypothetical protein KH172YL63_20730 [Bacillus sp. KH172YL63]
MENLGVSLISISLSLIMIGINIPLLIGKIKMNEHYGMRLGKAFESDENWYVINRYGAKRFIFWSALILISGISYLFLPPFSEVTETILLFAPCFLLLPPIFETYLFTRKL